MSSPIGFAAFQFFYIKENLKGNTWLDLDEPTYL